MGNRGNIKIDDVYLYTHWKGSMTEQIVTAALRRSRDRWDDSAYLTRIIFCELIIEDDFHDTIAELNDTIGYGISTHRIETNYPDVIINTEDQTVNGIPFHQWIVQPRS